MCKIVHLTLKHLTKLESLTAKWKSGVSSHLPLRDRYEDVSLKNLFFTVLMQTEPGIAFANKLPTPSNTRQCTKRVDKAPSTQIQIYQNLDHYSTMTIVLTQNSMGYFRNTTVWGHYAPPLLFH